MRSASLLLLVTAAVGVPVNAQRLSIDQEPPADAPMVFRLASSGDTSELCGDGFEPCPIIGEGMIDSGVAERFSRFVDANGIARATVILHSEMGGELDAGLSLGREIRRRGFSTALSTRSFELPRTERTECQALRAADNDGAKRTTEQLLEIMEKNVQCLGGNAYFFGSKETVCVSSCAYAFLGGVRRNVERTNEVIYPINFPFGFSPPGDGLPNLERQPWNQSSLGFHYFAPTQRLDADSDIAQRVTAEITQRKYDEVVAYLAEMGVNPNIATYGSRVARGQTYFFPNNLELERVEILGRGSFSDFELALESTVNGVIPMLLSHYSDPAALNQELRIFCGTDDEGEQRLALMVIFGDRGGVGWPAAGVQFNDVLRGGSERTGEPGNSISTERRLGIFGGTPEWSIQAFVDGKEVGRGGQYATSRNAEAIATARIDGDPTAIALREPWPAIGATGSSSGPRLTEPAPNVDEGDPARPDVVQGQVYTRSIDINGYEIRVNFDVNNGSIFPLINQAGLTFGTARVIFLDAEMFENRPPSVHSNFIVRLDNNDGVYALQWPANIYDAISHFRQNCLTLPIYISRNSGYTTTVF